MSLVYTLNNCLNNDIFKNMKYLSIDVGTTRCKCQLFDNEGNILEYIAKDYEFKKVSGELYVDVDAIIKNVKNMIKAVAVKHEINSVAVSSFGESFVLLDKDDNVLFYPMLYTDVRGEEQAKRVTDIFGDEKLFKVTGITAHSMYSLYKLLWIKENYPEVYKRADKVLLIGDYVGYKLTGKRVIDYALAARTGAFDVENKALAKEILNKVEVSEKLFSTPMQTGSMVGEISEKVKKELKIKGKPVLVLGSHDQICSALGAGVISTGSAVDGMGTVECIVVPFKEKPGDINMGKQGYPIVPFINGLYCTYILNYSCGSAVGWFNKNIMHGYSGKEQDFYAYMEKGMSDNPTGILVLPYFGGASTPYQDMNIKGAIINLTTQTSDVQTYQAIVEGTVMEMKLNADVTKEYGIEITELTATGGCSNSDKWMQLKSDIQGVPVKTLRSSEGGLCGLAMLQAVALKGVKDIEQAKEIFVQYVKSFTPNRERGNEYLEQYKKYKKLYHAIKEI